MGKLHVSAAAGSRVLIGAVESADRTLLQTLLFSWGYRTEAVGNGPALLEVLGRNEPAPILIFDTTLPGLDGAELLHRTQTRRAGRRIWTIAMTGADRTAGGAGGHSQRAAIDDILEKPWSEMELCVCMRTALRVQALHAEMLESADAARFHATHDTLTGLWNRESVLSMLFQETDRVQRTGTSMVLLLLDLDRFTQINREQGYDGGDNVLRQMAARLRKQLRSYDLIGRCGEDEFLVALPGGGLENARSMAARLRDCITERPFDILKASVRITASFGIAQSRGRSPLIVLREAESALSSAKRDGRDCVRFFDQGTLDVGNRGTSRETAGAETVAATR